MQSDVGEFVFQHLEEHWEKMCDGPREGQLRKVKISHESLTLLFPE